MFLPHGFGTALAMTVTSTLCWGSWANTYKLTRGYRFELFYWDYAIGIVLVSLVWAVTLGSSGGSGQPFLANVAAADGANIVWAVVGGIIFNIANLLLVAGIDMAGLAIAFPVAIGIALVVGVVLSYAIDPRGSPVMLACGVALALVAVFFDGRAYRALTQGGSPVSRKSLVVCVVSGVLMGSFAPFVTRALTSGHALGPYSIAVFFTLGALASCFVVNIYFMRHPLVGEPVDFSGFAAARPADHLLGIVGGFVWGTGTVFNFVAASFVGVAISYAIGQAAPMVAAIWGIAVWNEFRGAPAKAWTYVALMFACYVAALAVLASAYGAANGGQ
ncbi:MAG TPA: GRP family sugar transporter [Vicinamibacterales bacterium]|nr:GRP family sugar transporter [Vicinamibacterales bacterium]